MKGSIIIVEEDRSGNSESSTYAGNICHVSLDAAEKEWQETVEDAKTNHEGEFGWLADAIEERPEDVQEKHPGERWVSFSDVFANDLLNIYIHEVTIE